MSTSIAASLTVILLTTSMLTGCVKSCQDVNPEKYGTTGSQGPTVRIKKNASIFHFDHETVSELMIVKADPDTGDHWTARLERSEIHGNAPGTDWEIKSDSDTGSSFLDRKADGFLVLHLLDTLRTIQPLETDIQGPLNSLGLGPPRFALMWRSAEGNFEFHLGLPAKEPGSAYAWIPGQATFLAGGAALQMLNYLKTFESLRLKTWAGLTSDDVDEIEIIRNGTSIFYSQREGADWNNKDHKPTRRNVTARLEAITHSRVLKFVDDPSVAALEKEAVQRKPLAELILTDRHAHPIKLQIGRDASQKLIGLSSARPQGVFELYPESLRLFEPPGK